MSKGELRRRIKNYIRFQSVTTPGDLTEFLEFLDYALLELKKEMPNLPERLPRGFFSLEEQFDIKSEKWHSYARILESILNDYWNVYLKWFGEVKK